MMKAIAGWISNNRGLFIGICVGVVVAILFLTIGFWATLLVGVCVGAGAFFGTHAYIWRNLADWLSSLLRKR